MSLRSLVCALGIVGFILGHCVRSRAPWGNCFHQVSFRSLARALGVVEFTGVVGFTVARSWCLWYILGRWVHSGMLFGSSSVVGFTRVRPRGRWIHLESLGSLMRAMEFVGFTRVRHQGCSVHPWSLGSLHRAMEVDGFIRGRWVYLRPTWGWFGFSVVVGFARALWRSLGISVVVWFTLVRSGCC